MHTIQFNALLKKRKRIESNTEQWIRYAEADPDAFVKAIGFPSAKVISDKRKGLLVKDGVHIVAFYNKDIMHDPVYVTSKGVFPLDLLTQCTPPVTSCTPFGIEEQNMVDDLIPSLLRHLGVQDACSLSMVCKQWYHLVREDSAFWKRHCATLGVGSPQTTDLARTTCLRLTLHGFKAAEDSSSLRQLLKTTSFNRIATWMFSAFLRRQVNRLRFRSIALFNDLPEEMKAGAFAMVANTRDFSAVFLFNKEGEFLWKRSGATVFHYCSEDMLVQMYQTWIERCLTSK